MPNMNLLIGTHDLVLITIDTLRYDVAVALAEQGRTPVLGGLLPGGRWQRRHAPGNFTFASHAAMFAGFLPTPAEPGRHPRLFAGRFAGSETTLGQTWVFDTPDLVSGLAAASNCSEISSPFKVDALFALTFPGIVGGALPVFICGALISTARQVVALPSQILTVIALTPASKATSSFVRLSSLMSQAVSSSPKSRVGLDSLRDKTPLRTR